MLAVCRGRDGCSRCTTAVYYIVRANVRAGATGVVLSSVCRHTVRARRASLRMGFLRHLRAVGLRARVSICHARHHRLPSCVVAVVAAWQVARGGADWTHAGGVDSLAVPQPVGTGAQSDVADAVSGVVCPPRDVGRLAIATWLEHDGSVDGAGAQVGGHGVGRNRRRGTSASAAGHRFTRVCVTRCPHRCPCTCVRCVHCRLQFVKRSLADFVSVLFRRADGRDGAVSRAQFDSLGMLVRGGPSVVAQVRAVRVLARVWARVCDYCWCGYWCGCRKRARSCWE